MKLHINLFKIIPVSLLAVLLTSNPEFSVFMPCTLSMYEENGKTIIATMNMEIMLRAVKNNKVLYAEASNLFNSFKKMMNTLATNVL